MLGLVGVSYLGPIPLASTVVYKLIDQLFKVRLVKGVWIDKESSNFWSRQNLSFEDNERQIEANSPIYRFKWDCLAMLFLSRASTQFIGLVCIAYCFKYAELAGINQGCVTSIFSMMIFYVSVLFYFVYNERISRSKVLGIALMFPCVLLLAVGSTENDEEPNTQSLQDLKDSLINQ